MKHKYVKMLLMLSAAALTAGSPAVLFAQETAKEESTEADDTNQEKQNTGTFGKIISIEGNTIKVSVVTIEKMSRGSENGEMPGRNGAGSGIAQWDSTDGEIAQWDGSDSETTEKPDVKGENSERPEKPDGENPDGNPPELPEGADTARGMKGGFTESGEELTLEISDDTKLVKRDMESETEISVDDLSEGDVLQIEMEEDKVVSLTLMNMSGGQKGFGGDGQQEMAGAPAGEMAGDTEGTTVLTAVYTVDGEEMVSDSEMYESTEADVSTVLVTGGGSLTMTNAGLTKTGDGSDMDQSNFYGLNAGVAIQKESTASINDTVIETQAEGANAIFATGEGANITAENVKIHTTGNSSRGLDATYGGTVTATNVDITTEGEHCAAVATDRGEGTIDVTGGTLSTSGEGSPCIYSTGNISVTDVTGNASGSQTLVVEGKNSVTLNSCNLTGAGENGLMLYQSTSGDAGEGTAVLNCADSTLTTSSEGPMFYITNTDAEATLTNTTLNFGSGILVEAAGNDTNEWGQSGKNGGKFRLMGISQAFTGDVLCDEISTVEINLTQGSSLEGTVDGDNTGESVTVSLDGSSAWTLTGDSYVSILKNALEDNSNIISNGYTIYYDAENEENAWLGGETISLKDGGVIRPEE